jgi:tRNA-uridine 2-sulfurtransferase
MSDRPTVAVAMSGGVDSSVAAALLVERGYRVIGLMLRLWNEPGAEDDNRCCTPDAMALARRVAARLGIPFYALDVQEPFRSTVVQAFIDGYAQGITPNPCLVCNRQIRWGFLLEHARAMGAELMATGHYARVRTGEDGQARLLRGMDAAKDQSYVLSILNQDQLSHSLFPVGEFTKPEVRELASKFNLPVASRADSQDLCFLGKGDYRAFLARHAPETARPGPIVDPYGKVVGEHQGLANYTIGQRKGLGFSSPAPLYVIHKDVRQNTLVVGPVEALGHSTLEAAAVNWIAGAAPEGPFRAQVKIRYKAAEVWATVYPQAGERARVEFDQALRDITPGQRVVFYQDEACLGGGSIQAAGG